MDLNEALKVLAKGVHLVDDLAPLLSAVGVPQAEAIAKVSGVLLNFAEKVVERLEEGLLVFTDVQLEELENILARIQAKNDAMAKIIDAS